MREIDRHGGAAAATLPADLRYRSGHSVTIAHAEPAEAYNRVRP